MNAYGALDPGLATPSLSCALFLLKQHKKAVDNADVVIHGQLMGIFRQTPDSVFLIRIDRNCERHRRVWGTTRFSTTAWLSMSVMRNNEAR